MLKVNLLFLEPPPDLGAGEGLKTGAFLGALPPAKNSKEFIEWKQTLFK